MDTWGNTEKASPCLRRPQNSLICTTILGSVDPPPLSSLGSGPSRERPPWERHVLTRLASKPPYLEVANQEPPPQRWHIRTSTTQNVLNGFSTPGLSHDICRDVGRSTTLSSLAGWSRQPGNGNRKKAGKHGPHFRRPQ